MSEKPEVENVSTRLGNTATTFMGKEVVMNEEKKLLKVTIKYHGYSKGIDKGIKKSAEEQGLKWYASGIDLRSGIRDLCFEMGHL